VRRRLVLAIAGVAAVAVTLFAVPLGVVLAGSYHDKELLRLQRDTVAATRQIDLGRPAGDPVELPRSRDVLGVYDRGGRLTAGRGPARADGVVRAALAGGRAADRSGDGKLLAAVPLVVAERVTGAVRAARSDAGVAESARAAWLALAALALGLVVAAALAAVFLGGRLARPLEQLAGAARRLGDGDFSVRPERATIPEVDAVSAALASTARRLDDLVSRERAFSADASHQLRTPLTALRMELEALELRGGSDAPELAAALREVDRLGTTIDTLLAVARDAPRGDALADVAGVLDGLEPRWRAALAQDARPLRVAVRARSTTVRAAPTVVREVLDVLLANAAQHGAGAVDVVVRDGSGFLAVDVRDEGPGVPDRAGDVFARRAGSGHGIGLALARSLAVAEGGGLELTSDAAGTAFTLRLALGAADDGPAGPAGRAAPRRPRASSGR
jgi:signal transduction histidine kinase